MLPLMTKPSDALTVVNYLNTKVTGAGLEDAKATLEARLLDSRKITAYEAWGLITREDEHVRLTRRGQYLARASTEDLHSVFAEIILDIRAYRIAAEWIHHNKLNVVILTELARHWFDGIPNELGTSSEKTIRNQAACFLGLAAAAGLGKYLVGRHGQATRLEVDRGAVEQLIASSRLSPVPPTTDGSETEMKVAAEGGATATERQSKDKQSSGVMPEMEPSTASSRAIRVFVSHGPNLAIVDQVKTLLELGDLPYEVVVEQESTAIPVPEKVFDAMRKCDAAVMCVTADSESEREDGSFDINPNVLIEIGAAFVLYEKRVVLVWDRRISVPSNLQGLYRCVFEGNELSWPEGIKLSKAINEFKGLR